MKVAGEKSMAVCERERDGEREGEREASLAPSSYSLSTLPTNFVSLTELSLRASEQSVFLLRRAVSFRSQRPMRGAKSCRLPGHSIGRKVDYSSRTLSDEKREREREREREVMGRKASGTHEEKKRGVRL